MLENTEAFSGFSVDDVSEAGKFYGEMLGLKVSEESEPMSMLELHISGGHNILVYANRITPRRRSLSSTSRWRT